MKKIFVFAGLLLSLQLFAQPYPVTGITITLPSNPDPNTANWKNGNSMLTISATGRMVNGVIDGRVKESRILVRIRKNGAVACGSFTNTSAPASSFNTVSKIWSGSNAVSLLGQECILTPGDYELCVQFFGEGAAPIPLSEEKCKTFSIKAKDDQQYQPPQPLSPVDKYSFTDEEIKKPVTFRWTPVVPKPQEKITYRVRIWQLMQGQNSMQAMNANQPVITKEVNDLTQTVISNILTGPCKPPYLCDFVWNVQALSKDGKPVGLNNGTGETSGFTFSGGSSSPVTLTAPANRSTVSALQEIRFSWQPPSPLPGEGGYKIKIVEIKSDESPESALRTNKPFFEKDSLNYFRGNKPFFEKDSCCRFIVDYSSSFPKFIEGKNYAWSIQLLDGSGKPVGSNNGTSETFSFRVASAAGVTRISLVSPVNGETVRLQNPTFSWNFLPTPADYDGDGYFKIKIVEIKGDESPDNAIRTNKPFFEKDSLNYFVNKPIFEKEYITFEYPSSAPKFIEGKSYAWQVQALGRDGKPVGENNGTSDVWKFSMGTPGRCDISIDSVTYTCKGYNANGKPVYGFKIYIKNNSTSGVTNLGNTFATDANTGNAIPPSQNGTYLNTFPPTGGTVSNLSPATNVLTIIAPGAQQVITGDYTLNNPANKCVTFKVFASTFITSGSSVTGNSCSSLKDTCLAACLCRDCDAITANLSSFNTATPAGTNGNQFNLSGSINISVPVYAIEIDVQSYSFSSQPAACSNGVTGIEQSGMLLMPGSTINNNPVIQVYNENISGSPSSNNNATKQVKLISTTPLTGNIPLNLLIGLPGPIAGLEPGCCKMQYEVCVRIKVFYDEKSCRSCVFTKCIQFSN